MLRGRDIKERKRAAKFSFESLEERVELTAGGAAAQALAVVGRLSNEVQSAGPADRRQHRASDPAVRRGVRGGALRCVRPVALGPSRSPRSIRTTTISSGILTGA